MPMPVEDNRAAVGTEALDEGEAEEMGAAVEGGGREEGGGVTKEEDIGGAEIDVVDAAPVVLLPLVVEVGGCD